MRALVTACIVLLATTSISHGRAFSRFTQSGVSRVMYTYHSFNEDCTNRGGVIRVLTKPKHGTVTHFQNTSAPASVSHPCSRIMMEGFQVSYMSTPGYRGPDSFVLEVSFTNRQRWVDQFTIDVK